MRSPGSSVARVLCPLLSGLFASTATAQTPAPSVSDLSVVSLHRANQQWRVVTTIWLAADTTSTAPITFAPVQPAHGKVECADVESGARSTRCLYEPRFGYTGPDSFTYTATQEGRTSNRATVSIDVRSTGLRWDIQTGASTGLTSDAPDLSSLPDVIGGTNQDLMFTLNWQVKRPWQRVREGQAPTVPDPVLEQGPTGSFNFIARSGFRANPVAATVQELEGSAAPPAEGGSDESMEQPAGEASMGQVVEQQFIAEIEANWNVVSKFDGSGSFLEVGVLGKGAFDVGLGEATKLRKAADQLLEAIRAERGTFRYEAGIRIALKQYHETSAATTTIIDTPAPSTAGGQSEPQRATRASNVEDLLALEVALQRNGALNGLPVEGDSQNRWALRFMAYPEVPMAGKHTRFMLGVEASQALSGGPKTISFLYGGALSFGGALR